MIKISVQKNSPSPLHYLTFTRENGESPHLRCPSYEVAGSSYECRGASEKLGKVTKSDRPLGVCESRAREPTICALHASWIRDFGGLRYPSQTTVLRCIRQQFLKDATYFLLIFYFFSYSQDCFEFFLQSFPDVTRLVIISVCLFVFYFTVFICFQFLLVTRTDSLQLNTLIGRLLSVTHGSLLLKSHQIRRIQKKTWHRSLIFRHNAKSK